jgi:molybdopterin-synthase adenylyltransferase
MNDQHFVRQMDAVNMARLTSLNITLIGLGAIGSTCAVWLGKMGCVGLTCYDPDRIEAQNWSNQMYRDKDIGKLKAVALSEVMEQFGGHTPNAIAVKYENQSLSEVVISGVDSMESRKTIWKAIREKPEVSIYLDARIGLETIVVYAVRPKIREDRVAYSKTLFSDSEALSLPCTQRTICYGPLASTAVLCNLLKRFVNTEELPFCVTLDLATMTLITSQERR